MDTVYVFLIRNGAPIYILCGLGLLWFGNRFLRSQRQLRGAYFGLEREQGRDMQSTALLGLLGLGIIAGIVFYVNNQVAPTLPPDLIKPPPPTRNLFVQPLSSPTPLFTDLILDATPTSPVLAPTVTLFAGSVNTPNPQPESPDANATFPPNTACDEDITILNPRGSQEVDGDILVIGSANAEDFLFYQLEVLGADTDFEWLTTGQPAFETVESGVLDRIDMNGWIPGAYQIRLTVFDSSSRTIGFCQVQVQLI